MVPGCGGWMGVRVGVRVILVADGVADDGAGGGGGGSGDYVDGGGSGKVMAVVVMRVT